MITYQRLGDYIREVNVRNRELKVTKPMGINIDKHFMPSVANVIGTDLSAYKLVSKNQFACNLMHVGRDEKIPMAMQTDDNPIIVSPAYFVFEISQTEVLLPEYLMMWFSRPEFDRNAWFYTDADVRGGMDKSAFMDMMLPLPSIERQREIVSEYETLTNRIHLNEQMIQHLEATAQALYRKMFVDGIDKENLPESWRMGTLGEICEINPQLKPKQKAEIPFVDMDALPTTGYFIRNIQKRVFSSGMKFENGDVLFARITPCMENGKAAIVSDIPDNEIAFGSTEFIVLRGKKQKLTSLLATLVRTKEFRNYAKSQMKGTDGRQRVDHEMLKNYEMIIPGEEVIGRIESDFKRLYSLAHIESKENSKLTELQSLLLAKMGQ